MKNTLHIGDKVVLSEKFEISPSMKGVIFTVKSEPFDFLGEQVVTLEGGYGGSCAVERLTRIYEPFPPQTEPSVRLDKIKEILDGYKGKVEWQLFADTRKKFTFTASANGSYQSLVVVQHLSQILALCESYVKEKALSEVKE